MFRKEGQPGWEAIVPLYDERVRCRASETRVDEQVVRRRPRPCRRAAPPRAARHDSRFLPFGLDRYSSEGEIVEKDGHLSYRDRTPEDEGESGDE